MSTEHEILVQVKDMCKNFGVTVALNHVDIDIRRGEILGLIGENGSGKSTVSSIISGIQPPTSGGMMYQGSPWSPASRGIGMIVQEAGTIGSISVAENIFLGNYEPFKTGPVINKKKMVAEAKKALEKIGVEDIDPSLPAGLYDMQDRN